MQSYVIDWYNLDQLVFATTNSEYLKFDIENYYCKNNIDHDAKINFNILK